MSYSSSKYDTYTLEDWVIDDDFISYVNGGNNPTISDLSSNPQHSDNINEAKALVQQLSTQSPAISDQRLSDIFKDINASIDNRIDKKQSTLTFRRLAWVGGIAASIALIIFLLPGMGSKTEQYITSIGEKEEVELPDGSIVQINNSSELKFSSKDWSREVELIGEAFFKVEKGSKFTVASQQGRVTVLGTEFNVYDRSGLFEVECLEGKVQVDFKGGSSFILDAGDKLSDFNNDQVPVVKKQVVKEIDWLNKFVQIDSMDLGFVFDEIGRYYEVEFQNDSRVRTKHYEGFFTTSSLDSAMYQILWPLGIDFEIEGNKVIIK